MESRKQIDKIEELELQIERLKNSTQENSREELAKAQFKLGCSFKQQGDIAQAIQAWEAIKREDSPKQFAMAQFNLSIAFDEQGEIEKTIQAWESIEREDFPEAFARAQFNLGAIFNKRGDVNRAIQAWESIKKEDSPEQFAKAQFNLGNTFDNKGDIKRAIQTWRAIKREDFSDAFARAQFNLGVIFFKRRKIEESIEYFLSIQKNDELYLSATLDLLNDIIPYLIGSDIQNKFELINSILESRRGYYISDVLLDVLKLDEGMRENLLEIFISVNLIQENLKVLWEDEDFEMDIAHYTTPQVGFMMLDNNEPSKFRLNTIKGMNDPEEGKILYRYLNSELQNEESLVPFISCFTFNHDSLNQFRLYGKDSEKEATGISLVISKDKFFNQDGDIYSSVDFNQNIPKESLGNRKQGETSSYIHTLSIYRCIYLDPYQKKDELYLKVSHRDEWTFYRENCDEDTSSRWDDYQSKIKDIEDNVRKNLEDIKVSFIKIKGDEQAVNIAEKIILPLRYLIKHAAFREEQECRVIYISDICDEKIKVDNEKNQMYIEYGCELKDVIHKIYLSPGAEKYKDHFRRILKDREGKKVISSTNPFRIK